MRGHHPGPEGCLEDRGEGKGDQHHGRMPLASWNTWSAKGVAAITAPTPGTAEVKDDDPRVPGSFARPGSRAAAGTQRAATISAAIMGHPRLRAHGGPERKSDDDQHDGVSTAPTPGGGDRGTSPSFPSLRLRVPPLEEEREPQERRRGGGQRG